MAEDGRKRGEIESGNRNSKALTNHYRNRALYGIHGQHNSPGDYADLTTNIGCAWVAASDASNVYASFPPSH